MTVSYIAETLWTMTYYSTSVSRHCGQEIYYFSFQIQMTASREIDKYVILFIDNLVGYNSIVWFYLTFVIKYCCIRNVLCGC